MHRFYIPPEQCGGDTTALDDREAHHALHVLRLQPRDRVTVLDGAGREYLCEVRDAGRKSVRLAVVEKKIHPARPFAVTLLAAVVKGKFEDIVEKATELGAARIVPLLTERTVVQVRPADAPGKAEKWRHAAIEAIKQCGSPWLPQIDPPLTPKQFLARGESFELPLVASLREGSRVPRDCFREFCAANNRPPASVAVWVGPEGDFTAEEYDAIGAAGAADITLGPLVLRADTAAVYCLSVVNHELQAAR